jgi:HEAT repeat protein
MMADQGYDGAERPQIAEALGHTRGSAGSAALRSALAEALAQLSAANPGARPGFRDIACAGTWALGQRDGAAATDALLDAARHPDRDVSDYGVTALAVVGDGRAWDDIFARLGPALHRKGSPGGLRQAEARSAIEYLARHAKVGSDRAVRLITLVRERWRNIDRQDLLEQWWPGIGPGGPPPEAIDLSTHVARTPW